MLTKARLAGSFLGLCLGDALGAGVEAAPVEVARLHVAQGFHPFGQVTDDSQLTRELLLSIAEQGTVDPARFAQRVAALVARNGLSRAGPGTTAAVRRLLAGIPWQEAGEPAPYAGNGAAMRSAPLGILWGEDPPILARMVALQSRITHQNPRCAAGALAIATAAAIAARPGPPDPLGWLTEIARAVNPLDTGLAEAIAGLRLLVGRDPDDAVAHFRSHRLEPMAIEEWCGVSSDVTSSVCWSLYAASRSPNDYLEAVSTAIWAGGDTDTTAAMTGGIVGARLGISALPENLLARLIDQGEWSGRELIELAERCARVVDRESA